MGMGRSRSPAGGGGQQTGIGGLPARTGGPRAGAGRLGARPGRPRTGAGRWLAGGGWIHAWARDGTMLRSWPAKPCRTSLPPVSPARSAIPWLSDPARGQASAGRHGISGWLRRLSRYHGSPPTGRDGSPPARGIIAKLLTTMPGPGTTAPTHPRTAACPTPGPRSRPIQTQCCGVRLNEAGRPAALIMGGSSMLELLPPFPAIPAA
jgi:hypothetical protein